jgi:hypothetical protein
MALQRSGLFGPDLACQETNVALDREDGRLRSRKQTSTDSTRKVGLETWGSDYVPDHGKGFLAPVKERGKSWGRDFKSGTQALQPARPAKTVAS